MVINDFVKKGATQVYRKLFIKRVGSDGMYESNWFEITSFVQNFGTITESYGDNLILGTYQLPTLGVSLDNSRRKFNDQNDSNSLFAGFKSRIKTKFRFEIGFIELASDDLQGDTEVLGRNFYGILFSEPINSDTGIVTFRVASIMKVFQIYTAFGVDTSSTTSSGMIDRIVKSEKNGARIFDQFFEGSNDTERYQIQSTTDNISAPLIQERDTVWDKIKDYSFYENFYPGITDDGNFEWRDRAPTGSFEFKFNGAGSFDNEFGINIVRVSSEVAGVDQTWSRAVIEFDDDMFAESFTSWTPGDGSIQDIYGERTYNERKKELDQPLAQIITDRITTLLGAPKRRWNILTSFIPHLRLNDRVEINYMGEQIERENPFILGVSVLGGTDVLGGFLGSINIAAVTAKISSLSVNIDSLNTNFELTEV